MEFQDAITGQNIRKRFKDFTLDLPELHVPGGFATALIGENGAGKSTLINLLAGIRLDYQGEITFFGNVPASQDDQDLRKRIGYTGPNDYFLPNWTIDQFRKTSEILFDNFHPDRFDQLTRELGIPGADQVPNKKAISTLSDGNRMKLEIAGALARDTDLLLMDEPSSPLDPLMRDELNDRIRAYLEEGQGDHTVFFSTHNVADMESVTDYVILMHKGRILEQGFAEDLKTRYVMVKADMGSEKSVDRKSAGSAAGTGSEALFMHMLGGHQSGFGVEGLMKAEYRSEAEAAGAAVLIPTLSELVVALMKEARKGDRS